MPCRAVLGGQWGDEGKGKIVDYLGAEADAVVRCQGGANAGHTLVLGGRKIALHLVPAGVLHPHCEILLGSGMVVDPLGLCDEIRALEAAGVGLGARLRVSRAAHLVLPYHKLQDELEERERGGGGIGTTGRGIGPAYADKAARTGLTVALFGMPRAQARQQLIATGRRKLECLRRLHADIQLDLDAMADSVLACADRLSPRLDDTTQRIHALLEAGKTILLEGAQGALLDLDHGSYPYVTSSSCTTAGALAGAGAAPRDLTAVVGVVKAYSTRVGNGPFLTELHGGPGDRLRQLGHEFGATTGRPRRCGWFDAVAVRYAARLSGFTELALTKLDVLDEFDRIPVAYAYRLEDQEIHHFPALPEALSGCRPVYREVEGWRARTTDCRRAQDLPRAARRYVDLLAELVGVPIRLLSVGPERDSTIRL